VCSSDLRVLTETNERIITQLANLYNLESYELEKALIWALTDEHKLDIEQFRAACHDFFSTKQNVANVKLTMRTAQPGKLTSSNNRPASKMDQLIERLESISPKQLLEDLSGGNHASEQDLKMISDIMVQQGLTSSVMNVLIHFTMLKTNMMLSRPYMEKIASHWSRAQLKTAKEAMEFALQQGTPQQQGKKRTPYRKHTASNQGEIIPDWFKERDKASETQKESTPTKEELEAQKEMAAILKKYSNT